MSFAPAFAGDGVYDIPVSSPEKQKKPAIRGSRAAPKSQPATKDPPKRRGRPRRGTARQATIGRSEVEARSEILESIEVSSDDALQNGVEGLLHNDQEGRKGSLGSQGPVKSSRPSKAALRKSQHNQAVDNQQSVSKRKQRDGKQHVHEYVNGDALKARTDKSISKTRRRRGEALGSPEGRQRDSLRTTSPEIPRTSTSTQGNLRRSSRVANKGSGKGLEKGSSQPPTNELDSALKVVAKSKTVPQKAGKHVKAKDRGEEGQSDNLREDDAAYEHKDDADQEDNAAQEDDAAEENGTAGENGAAEENGTAKEDAAAKENGEVQESNTGDNNADSDATSLTTCSDLDDEAPSFECFGEYNIWLRIREAALEIGLVETDGGPRRKRPRIYTRVGRDLLEVINHLTDRYDELSEVPPEKRQEALMHPDFEDIEVSYDELSRRIKGVSVDCPKDDIVEFTTEIYRAFIPELISLLEAAMIALSPIYAHKDEHPGQNTSLISLKRIAYIQSLILQLCDRANSWRATYLGKRKIKHIGKTTKSIFPDLKNCLKPAFDGEFRKREREIKYREQTAENERIAAEQEARFQADMEDKKMRVAEIMKLQMRQLQDAQRRNRNLAFGLG